MSTVLESVSSDSQSSSNVATTFNQMLTSGYISIVSHTDTQTAIDVRFADEAKAIKDVGGILSAAELKKIRAKVASNKSESSSKRKIVYDYEEMASSSKKKKSSEKNKDIAQLALNRFNPAAQVVINALISQVQNQLMTCHDNERSPPVYVHQLSPLIESSLPVHSVHSNQLVHYLDALSQDNVPFVYKDDETNGGAYSLHLKKLSESLKLKLMESTLLHIFGLDALRIWRVLLANGKLDDKQIAKFAMTSLKVTRERAYQLFKRNFILLQNVPKSADHTRCFHLHGVDLTSCAQNMLDAYKKAITRLFEKKKSEDAKHLLLKEKLARSDVMLDLSLLNASDVLEKEKMDKVDDLLRVSILRLDKCVMTLSEY